MNLLGFAGGLRETGSGPEAAIAFFTGTLGMVFGVIGVVIGVLILIGALKMKKLESYNWAMASSILALAPCVSPCCVVGMPVGIWALVVLSKPEIKESFQQRTAGHA
jgi:hypothetical protein